MKKFKVLLKSKNFYFQEVLGFLFLLFAIYFFRHEAHELKSVGKVLRDSRISWIIAGVGLTIAYIFIQALMYVYSFKTVGSSINFKNALRLFLKRNLISVFLPGGSITSLAFFTKDLESDHISKTKINFASYIYAVVGILSVFLVALPIMIYLLFTRQNFNGELWAFGLLSTVLILLIYATWSLAKRGWVYRLLLRFSPEIEVVWKEIKVDSFSRKALLQTIFISVLIEFIGIAHLWIAMMAIGKIPNLEAAVIGYIIATIFLIISPFLRGMGAIELSLTLLLIRFGFTTTSAASITIVYRLFEFWLPLLAGICIFVFNRGNILLRLLPAILLFGLGLVNIISVLTPALKDRVKILAEFLPKSTIDASNYLVLFTGILLIITAGFLIRGLRNAWFMALALCIFSLIGNLTKAFDYEEAMLAFTVLIALIITQKQYFVKTSRHLQIANIGTALWTFLAVIIYGIVGFYFLDKRHFNIDFGLREATICTFDNFTLLNNEELVPQTRFAHLFLYSINLLGVCSISFVFYAFIKPYFFEKAIDANELQNAKQLVEKYGKSPVDYFKTYSDKLFYFSPHIEGFIAYRVANGFAIVLEEPVCEDHTQSKSAIVKEFEVFCAENGIKPAYYRVDETSLLWFESLGKKSMIIGQEAVLNLDNFSLEGKERKSMRNAANSMQKNGFLTKVYEAPIKAGLLQKLKSVSDEWLESTDRNEIIFSQGMFDLDELRNQTIITLENTDEKILAFLNVIPDYAKNETTYDLIRKTEDSPRGNMDVLIIALINYSKSKGYKFLNLGLAPMSGIEKGRDLPEKTIKYAYEKIQQFKQYKGLRDFKEKFDPEWHNKYLVYEHHYDLLQLPLAISKVIKP
ncbi:MAG: phosphatidylglycerol lysyltransferase domain-containing protein [Sphingobacteriaceae bacterium]